MHADAQQLFRGAVISTIHPAHGEFVGGRSARMKPPASFCWHAACRTRRSLCPSPGARPRYPVVIWLGTVGPTAGGARIYCGPTKIRHPVGPICVDCCRELRGDRVRMFPAIAAGSNSTPLCWKATTRENRLWVDLFEFESPDREGGVDRLAPVKAPRMRIGWLRLRPPPLCAGSSWPGSTCPTMPSSTTGASWKCSNPSPSDTVV